MDEPLERPVPDPASSDGADAAAESDSNDVAFAVVFGVVGLALVLSLDTPWAGLPMVVLGLYFGFRAFRRDRRPGDGPEATPSTVRRPDADD
jgi:hypothetical protein